MQFIDPTMAELFKNFMQFLDEQCLKLQKVGSENSTESADLQGGTIQIIVSDIASEIERIQQHVYGARPELSTKSLQEFRYLLAAWGDEVMIKLSRTGLPLKQSGQIENKLFGTAHAGEEIFVRIAEVVKRRNADDLVLAGAYAMALIMGFEGRYLDQPNPKELKRLGEALLAIAVRKKAEEASPKVLLPEENLSRSDRKEHSLDKWPTWIIAATLVFVVSCACMANSLYFAYGQREIQRLI